MQILRKIVDLIYISHFHEHYKDIEKKVRIMEYEDDKICFFFAMHPGLKLEMFFRNKLAGYTKGLDCHLERYNEIEYHDLILNVEEITEICRTLYEEDLSSIEMAIVGSFINRLDFKMKHLAKVLFITEQAEPKSVLSVNSIYVNSEGELKIKGFEQCNGRITLGLASLLVSI